MVHFPSASSTGAARPVGRAFALLAIVVVAALVGTLAVAMTGDAPTPLDSGISRTAPPLVLRDGTGKDTAEALGAAALERDDLADARRIFSDLVAEHPRDIEGQVGLALAQWRSAGPQRVGSLLDQLVSENPGDAYVLLHAGVVQLMLDDRDRAQRSLVAAVKQGFGEARQFDVARRADDVLHPGTAPGYPTLLIREADVAAADDRRTVAKITSAVASDDRILAAQLARSFPESRRRADPAVATVVALAMYSKDDAAASIRALESIDASGSDARMVQVHLAVVQLWGGDKLAGRRTLAAIGDGSDRWARQATALERALDA